MKQAQFLNKDLESLLEKTPLYSQRKGMDAEVLFKIFNPYCSDAWYVLEGELQYDGDWILYVYDEKKEIFRYMILSEFEKVRIKINYLQMPLEIDDSIPEHSKLNDLIVTR